MKKGIFCIEGFWEQGDIRDKTSVFPILEMLDKNEDVPYLYHRCGTKEEVFYMLERWCTKRVQQKYPILYFATHGEEGLLDFGKRAKITIDELEEQLHGKATGAIFFFGSCFTMKKDIRRLKKFIDNTDALAAMGYTIEVNWFEAAAAELLAHYFIQQAKRLDDKGMKEIQKEIDTQKRFFKSQGFRMVQSTRPFRRSNKK